LEDRIQGIQRRMDERATWLRMLDEVSRSLPGAAWIASLSVEPDGNVNLSGYAATASALIRALEETETLGSVELASPATRAAVGGRELEAYNIRGILRGSLADSARTASADSAQRSDDTGRGPGSDQAGGGDGDGADALDLGNDP
nr:PilN domain-containing protein [Gemmatimonadota bacterium]